MNEKSLLQFCRRLGIPVILAGGLAATAHGQTVLFSESFETDGAGTRYAVENQSDDEGSDFFNRRQERSTGTRVAGGTIDGDWFWAAQDLDADGTQVNDLEADEGRITWLNPIDISGYGNLTLSLAAGSGGNELEFDNVLFLQYRIDGGEWINAGGFRGTYTDSPGRYFEGDETVLPPNTNPRLTRTFQNFEWKLFATGSQMELRVLINANGGTEEYGFDNLTVVGDNTLGSLGLTPSANEFSESAGAAAGQFNFTLSPAAPAGGLTVTVFDSDTDDSELSFPSEITIPAGSTNFSVDFDVVADGRFDGAETVFLYFEAEGYGREIEIITVNNVDAKPNVFITELYPTPVDDNLLTDTNGDGVALSQQDEMIEIVNLESTAIDFSGWTVNDDLGPRHVFPVGTIVQPGQAIVVFGGGEPTGLFGGAIVQTASTGNLAPSAADTMALMAGTAQVDAITFEADIGDRQWSIVRAVELDPTSGWVSLQDIAGDSTAPFNPGLRNDGTPIQSFSNEIVLNLSATSAAEGAAGVSGTVSLAQAGSVEVTLSVEGEDADEVTLEPSVLAVTEAGATFTITPVRDGMLDGDREVRIVATAPDTLLGAARFTVEDINPDLYDVVVNEVFASIFGTAADINGNGLNEELVEDLYIEIVNRSDDQVNLGGWQVLAYTEENRRGAEVAHVFPNPTILPGHASLVLMGGGDEAAMNAASDTLFGGAIVQVANTGGNGINLPDDNVGIIKLVTAGGHIEDSIRYESDVADQSQALTRSPDLSGQFPTLHFDVSTAFELYSPGRMLDGSAFTGNAVAPSPAAEVFPRMILETSDGYLADARLGWLYTDRWPFVYSYAAGGWWYAPSDSADGQQMIFYDYNRGSWIFTSYLYFAWYFDYNQGDWFLF
jgi:hypothetical protein